ncbi:MAG TPA: glycosyltransferase family 39 protein, partial [Candidatus Polarisedimenticolaceae bacterium]|nr:glycosyltransferase family 39 protein [Candidatus Polarisedimenticolaceae bacterium]
MSRARTLISSRGFLVAVLVLAAALRVGHVLSLRPLPLFERLIVDSEVYDHWGQRIASGDLLSRFLPKPFFMDPLYSYALGAVYATVGRSVLLVRLLQAALGVGTCALAAILGRKVRDAASGNLAALLMALYAPAIFQEGEFEKTALGVFLATAALVLFLKKGSDPFSWKWKLAAGVVLGLSALTRGNVLLVAPWAMLFLAWKRDWRAAGAFLFGLVVALSPATIRNRVVSGDWVLTTSMTGQNFYQGNNPTNPDGAYHPLPFVRPQSLHEPDDFQTEAERRAGHALTVNGTSAFWLRETFRYLASSPGFAARAVLGKLGLFWSDVEIPDTWDMRFIARYSPVLRLPLVPFSLIVALFAIGVVPAARSEDGRIVIGYVGAYLLSILAFFVLSRYRLHAVPALAAVSGAGLTWGAERVRARAWRSLAVPVACAVALGAFSALSFRSYRVESPNNHALLAELYQERGDYAAGRSVLDDALSAFPESAPVLVAEAKLCLRTRDVKGALSF